jgi:hypothetical protein
VPPKMRQPVTITTPGGVVVDPVTGNEGPSAPTTVQTRAYLAAKPVGDVGSQIELLASQDTTISLWTILVPTGTVLTSASTVIDESGNQFQVVGDPADRPSSRPQFRAAALRLISDLQ